VDAIFAYLRSVPTVRSKVAPPERYVVAGDRGTQVYYACGCNGCHGLLPGGRYCQTESPDSLSWACCSSIHFWKASGVSMWT
jgi:hypothetical protein